MTNEADVKIYLFLNKSRQDVAGLAPLYARITPDGLYSILTSALLLLMVSVVDANAGGRRIERRFDGNSNLSISIGAIIIEFMLGRRGNVF